MSEDELLDELLVRWWDEYDKGCELLPQELCRDAPHLANRAAEEIAKLKRIPAPGTDVDLRTHVPPTPPIPKPPTPAPKPAPARAFAGLRYEPQGIHKSGGLGDVFVALDREVGREVALKRIQTRLLHDPASVADFEREAEITGRLEHPGVVPLYGRGRDADGRPYYAMRFIRGESLRDAILDFHEPKSAKKSPGERAVAFRGMLRQFTAACNTVAYAHSRGVIHRDLKPANIMLGPYGETLVVDWGLAKYVGRDEPNRDPAEESLRPALGDAPETKAGAHKGTAAFMSPEHAKGQWAEVGPGSDVFLLGATLYQLLTGRPPYQGGTARADAQEGKFPPPRQVNRDVPRALEAVCLKAMAFRPEDRYATAQDLARDVDRWLADEPPAAYREPWRVRAWRWLKRHRTPAAATAAVLLTAALLAGGAWWWNAREAKERERQKEAAARQEKEMEQAVKADLEEASQQEKAGAWAKAKAAVARADGRLAGSGPEDLQARVRQAKVDLDMAAHLEELNVRTLQIVPLRIAFQLKSFLYARDAKQTDKDYTKVFQEYGVPLDAADAAEAADRIKGSAIREQLVTALDRWIILKRHANLGGAERLTAEVQGADSCNWRQQLRQLLARGDRTGLEKLAGRAEALGLPPEAQAELGLSLYEIDADAAAVEALRKAQVRRPDNFSINFLLALALHLMKPPQLDEAGGFYRAALAIRPDSPLVHINLGDVLSARGHLESAAVEYGLAVELNEDPADAADNPAAGPAGPCKFDGPTACCGAVARSKDDAEAHYNLGLVLLEQGNLAEAAAAEFRRAVQIKKDYGEAHYNLGLVLHGQGKLDEAAAECRRAVQVKADNPKAHYRLGLVLQDQGKGDEAAVEYRAAVRFFGEAFAAQPAVADDLASGNRYMAACAAALAGGRHGPGASRLDEMEGARLRNLSLEWLRAELTAWDKRRQDDAKGCPTIQRTLLLWQSADPLAGVREADALEKLPEAERQAWGALWADVGALLARVSEAKAP